MRVIYKYKYYEVRMYEFDIVICGCMYGCDFVVSLKERKSETHIFVTQNETSSVSRKFRNRNIKK